jgi:hypothetical protein
LKEDTDDILPPHNSAKPPAASSGYVRPVAFSIAERAAGSSRRSAFAFIDGAAVAAGLVAGVDGAGRRWTQESCPNPGLLDVASAAVF